MNQESTIPTGRSWRDLPDSPPEGDPPSPIPRPTKALPPVATEPTEVTVAPTRRWPWLVLVAAALVGLLIWSPWGGSLTTQALPETVAPASTPSPSPMSMQAPSTDEPVADVAEALLPSVVQIEHDGGVGSGFVYNDQGQILTAAHVVEGTNQVRVRLSDGRTVTGTVLGRDGVADIAVVQADISGIPPAPLALDKPPRVGQLAVAIGSPFGFQQTVTSGVVSAVGRSLTVGGQVIDGLIQTDAPINSGNSGGPLADRFGRVIGINVAIATRSGGSDGLGFSVPIAKAIAIAERFTGDRPDSAPPVPLDDLATLPSSPSSGNPLGGMADDLRRKLEDQLGNTFGFRLDGVPGTIIPGELPPGYQIAGFDYSSSNGSSTQTTTLVGPQGDIVIRASQGQPVTAEPPAGAEPIKVRGSDGWLADSGGDLAVEWEERPDLSIRVDAPTVLGRDAVLSLIEALEVSG